MLPACEAAVRALEARDDDAIMKFTESIELFSATEFGPRRAVVHLDYAQLLQRLGFAKEAVEQLDIAESLLGSQTGVRAARIASLRQATRVKEG